MANGFDPGSMYDVDAPQGATGYLSEGSAMAQTLQREMLRRAQFIQQQEEQARQAQLDQQANELRLAQLANTKESTASLVQGRQASADLARQNVTDKQTADFQAQYGADEDITNNPDAQATAKRLGLRINNTPATPATPAVTGAMDPDSGLPAADTQEVPGKPAQVRLAGSVKQQQEAAERKFAESIATQSTGLDTTDPTAMNAAWKMAGGKGNLPAGYLQPKKTSAEKDTEYNAAMKRTWARDNLAKQGAIDPSTGEPFKPLDKQESADLDVFKQTSAGQTTGQKFNNQITLVDKRDEDSQNRATTAYVRGLKNSFRTELEREDAALAKDIERVDRAVFLLKNKSFAADAVAAPEFLQIVAGGMGSGLRMTDAELRRVNEAQNKFDQWRGQVAKWNPVNWGTPEGVTIQDDMRKTMAGVMKDVEAARRRHDDLKNETLHRIGESKSEEEADSYQSKYWRDKTKVSSMDQTGNGSAAPARVWQQSPSTGRRRYSDDGGKTWVNQ